MHTSLIGGNIQETAQLAQDAQLAHDNCMDTEYGLLIGSRICMILLIRTIIDV